MANLEFKDLITILGILIAATSLVFTAINTRINMRTNRARFWLGAIPIAAKAYGY